MASLNFLIVGLNFCSGPTAVLWTSALIALGAVAFKKADGNI
jgi:hypothetical protein